MKFYMQLTKYYVFTPTESHFFHVLLPFDRLVVEKRETFAFGVTG